MKVKPVWVGLIGVVALLFGMLTTMALADGTPTRLLTICKNTKFALCAASTCVATGGMITGNDGVSHPEVTCVCPVLQGNNIADLNGGNMQGSCNPPDKTHVWSTFQFNAIIPQNNGVFWNPFAVAVLLKCPATDAFSQCWNWECTLIAPSLTRVSLARCSCPEEQTNYAFITQAGQGNSAACSQLPVGGPLFFDPETILGSQ